MSSPSLDSKLPDTTRLRSRSSWIASVVRRVPWLVPAISFTAGWIGFAMIKRGEGLARIIALTALLGWLWLLIEPLVRRYLERRKAGVGKFVANFFSQSLQQEMLFFALPLWPQEFATNMPPARVGNVLSV